eukprot:tig00000571_g2155.t1
MIDRSSFSERRSQGQAMALALAGVPAAGADGPPQVVQLDWRADEENPKAGTGARIPPATVGIAPKFDLPVDAEGKATKIKLLSFKQPHMRELHCEWIAFFTAFLAWFSVPAVMPTIRADMGLTRAQVSDSNSVGVGVTILARVLIGPLADRIGPRLAMSTVLLACSVPVACVGLSTSYTGFVACRAFISLVGASFVCNQMHTSLMFSRNVVGTANAMAGGWGNMGGGVAQLLIPLLVSGFVAGGFSEGQSWRYAMVIPGGLCAAAGLGVALLAQDTPHGPIRALRAAQRAAAKEKPKGPAPARSPLRIALTDYRTYVLAAVYVLCFGMEITVNSTIVDYVTAEWGLSRVAAGGVGSIYGLMNIFSRLSGGLISDRAARSRGPQGRILVLFAALMCEGACLIAFSRMKGLPGAVILMVCFAYFCQASSGMTFGCVPLLNREALGASSGVVGAAGNLGSLCFLQLFKTFSYPDGYAILGGIVLGCSCVVLTMRFPEYGGASAFRRGANERTSTKAEYDPVPDNSIAAGSAFDFSMPEPSVHIGPNGIGVGIGGPLSLASIGSGPATPGASQHGPGGSQRGHYVARPLAAGSLAVARPAGGPEPARRAPYEAAGDSVHGGAVPLAAALARSRLELEPVPSPPLAIELPAAPAALSGARSRDSPAGGQYPTESPFSFSVEYRPAGAAAQQPAP